PTNVGTTICCANCAGCAAATLKQWMSPLSCSTRTPARSGRLPRRLVLTAFISPLFPTTTECHCRFGLSLRLQSCRCAHPAYDKRRYEADLTRDRVYRDSADQASEHLLPSTTAQLPFACVLAS